MTDAYVPLTGPPAWRHAACRDDDPEMWFPLGTGNPAVNRRGETAYDICRRCDHREQCIQFAKDTGSRDGIWGGVNLDGQPIRGCALPGCDRPNVRRRSLYCSTHCSDMARYRQRQQLIGATA
jgi:WhiB family redox-sensing transcriptional regulator